MDEVERKSVMLDILYEDKDISQIQKQKSNAEDDFFLLSMLRIRGSLSLARTALQTRKLIG